ncbi:MAG: GUN4 domain-containing protein [Crocosphaera sp.]|nr:GUN4 domain-containing protein [Crocosphaera sp.]
MQQLQFCLDLPVDKKLICASGFSLSTCRKFLKRNQDLGQRTFNHLCDFLNIDINNEQLVVINSNPSPNYPELEKFLSDQDFQSADQETYNIMIQAVGKQLGESFDAEDINNFPCNILVEINSLWEQYSNQKFGFKKQTQIWLNCGGEIDKIDDKNCLYKFWHRLGWYVGKPMIYDVENAPIGHLPRQVLREFCELSFMSRFVTCERDEEQ